MPDPPQKSLMQPRGGPNSCGTNRVEASPTYKPVRRAQMIRDLLLAALIVVIAVVLGIAVHPLLLLLLILAAIWLFGRHRTW
jgi:hypothetical protein